MGSKKAELSQMQDRFNKPRVFLSHSSLDKGFVETLYNDLLKCRIDPWLDTVEIRDGRPWLEEIFEGGLTTCDAIIIYITESSLSSNMVAKEIDAAQVRQLSDAGVSILPYVNRAELREKLRLDLRSLQCREWNSDNYSEVLPSVVAEIWRSYMERTVGAATLQEKSRRLELELEVKNIQERYGSSVFTPSENREFEYIHNMLDRQVEATIPIYAERQKPEPLDPKIGEDVFKFSLIQSIARSVGTGDNEFGLLNLNRVWIDELRKHNYPKTSDTRKLKYQTGTFPDVKERLLIELKVYGLVKGRPDKDSENAWLPSYTYEFTDKMYRFIYWLGYNNYSVEDVSFEHVESIIRK